ncbi:RNA-guided endonuclease InsQ/TnpB family protein, partial [Fusobacterium polymorphum]
YKKLNSNMAQQVLKEVDRSFKSFFGLLKLAKNGQYDNKKIKLPKYLAKDAFTTIVIGFVRLKDGMLIIPYSNSFKKTHEEIAIKLPPILKDKKIKEIRIIPKQYSRYFEIQYTYEVKEVQRELNKENGLGIDLGIDNLCTCVTNTGASFLIDGRKLKSINRYYNKINAKLQSIKDKQKIERTTLRQKRIARKKNNRIEDYLSKVARIIINYCLNNDIGKIVLGYNEDFQRNSNIGSINNQNFVNIPYGKLRDKLIYLCKLYGIEFKLQEESYTSKASFFDGDEIPIYDKENSQEYIFSGKRIKRGLYQTRKGKLINADCNGALNILRKSKVVDLSILYNRGELNTPKRIRVV